METKKVLVDIIQVLRKKRNETTNGARYVVWGEAISVVEKCLREHKCGVEAPKNTQARHKYCGINSGELSQHVSARAKAPNKATVTKPKTAFGTVLENRIAKIQKVLAEKECEYAHGDNRFHNFDVAGRMINCSPEAALKGMMVKHEVCVMDMIEGNVKITDEMIDEKIGDSINYLILLEGVFRRRL